MVGLTHSRLLTWLAAVAYAHQTRLFPRASQFMTKIVVVSDGKKITRSHVIVGADGKFLDIQIGVSP